MLTAAACAWRRPSATPTTGAPRSRFGETPPKRRGMVSVVNVIRFTTPLIALALGACTRTTQDGATERGDADPPIGYASAPKKPRKPELEEVSSAPYYAAFGPIDWPQAERLLRAGRESWVEENQAARAYVTTFDAEGRIATQGVAEVPLGVDVAALARELRGPKGDGPMVKHIRYEQIPWTRAIAVLRGQVAGITATSIFAAHHDRVFLHTSTGEDLLAIESPNDALDELLKEIDPTREKFNLSVE